MNYDSYLCYLMLVRVKLSKNWVRAGVLSVEFRVVSGWWVPLSTAKKMPKSVSSMVQLKDSFQIPNFSLGGCYASMYPLVIVAKKKMAIEP